MKKLIIGTTAFLMTIGMMPSQAQDGPPQFRPVEMWACKYRDRKDQSDMNSVYESFVEVIGDDAYGAWHLNPWIVGNRTELFDFIFLGAWETASGMGSDMARYLDLDEAADVEAEWDEVAECNATMFASNRIQANAPDDGNDGPFMLTVSDCTIAHGNTPAQAVGAISRYNDYRVANGSTVGTIVWFPIYGGGNAEFDFKLAQTYSGIQALGDSMQWNIDNASYNVRNAMMQGVVDCDESRVYFGTTIINNMAPAN